MNLAPYLPFLLGLVVGALIGAAAVFLFSARRSQSQLLDVTGRLSAAEAAARLEEERRTELEGELQQARTRMADLDRMIAVAREREEKAQQLIAELKEFTEQSRRELQDRFKALALDALAGSSRQFLDLAEERFKTSQERARSDLDKRKQAIEALMEPLRETLQNLDNRTNLIEKARVDAYSRIDQQVQLLAKATATLQEKTTSLTTALKSSQVRGRWGEIALRNVAELAGMSEHCDFDEQAAAGDGKRPDMTVHLPGGRKIAVDAKAPLSAYLEATDTSDEPTRKAALIRHVKALKDHIRTLSARNYAEALESDLDLVVMFLPGDPFLSAAFTIDPDLQMEALRSKVLIATPTTLVALLRTVAIYWQQRSLAENAEVIANTARELYDRAAKFTEDLSKIGRGLGNALKAYNEAVGSFDRRLMPMGKRLEELKVSEQSKRGLVAPEAVDEEPRKLND